jgi:sialic acid synthase SpsE
MKTFSIGNHTIGYDHPPYIIAEIGNNHDGELEQAFDLIDAAGKAGANAVKFQTYRADKLVTREHELYDFFSKFALPFEWHPELKARANKLDMDFISTPFDKEAADFLAELGLPAFKISSSDLTNLPLIRHCAKFNKPLLISTGMGSLKEAGAAIESSRISGCKNISLLHCISIYPTPPKEVQLNTLVELRRLFDVPIGFSDHSLSPTLPAAAAALGARIIEKHITLSRTMDGPDHAVALEPDEFKVMTEATREACEAMHYSGKTITDQLKNVRWASLRGLYAAVNIKAGTILTEKHLLPLRPVAEFTVDNIDSLLGRKTAAAFKKEEAISSFKLED